MTETARVILWLESEYDVYKNTVWYVNELEPTYDEMRTYVEELTFSGTETLMGEEFINCFLNEVDWLEVIANFEEEDKENV